ncbi:hypothetical protein C4D60_Mb07t07850 [Musa balbisiana]|uniref:F-box protein At3g26010-like beta-propeller domain-containing protein n=1 Tax=Musa balbisiana TaxID=52838 RepID=A0A4V4H6I0_MUSBA|nr:hypothetical protein C4D60_Mb07t07850 [Musa balbisiana]
MADENCWDTIWISIINIIVGNKISLMARIPEDIFVMEILPMLPYDSLFRLKFVCKSWLHFITHHLLFARQHLSCNGTPGFIYVYKHCTIEFQPTNIFGKFNICKPVSFPDSKGLEKAIIITSTNGLILLEYYERDSNKRIYYVWNLMTNEVHVIPIRFNHHRWHVSAGLAFEPSATPTSYKVVELIEKNQCEFYKCKFKIYSSDTGKWIMSDQKFIIPYKIFLFNPWNVLYKGGVIYWNSFPI